MIRLALGLGLLLALGACATRDHARPLSDVPSLDVLARQYLGVQLAIGQKDPGYVDAYYGPPALAARAERDNARTSLAQLEARVIALDLALGLVRADPGTIEAGRVHYLRAMLNSARVRLAMLRGQRMAFSDEAEGLFGVRPEPIDLALLEPVLARIEELVPGTPADGPLHERLNAFQDRFIIPADRLRAVIDKAVEECRARTIAHISLPEAESFSLSLVTDKPWGAFNHYKGNFHSVIEINTDLPTRLDRAIEVGCHEAYPGHHVYSVLVERDRVRALGQIEFTLIPLYSPRAIIAEGSAEHGVKLAFAGNSQMEFERDVLAPLAGLATTDLAAYHELREATRGLESARIAIAARYVDGALGREQAIEALMRYRLDSRAQAEQSLRFIDTYRSYVINYGLGEQIVADFVARGGPDPAARWRRFATLLSEPLLPEDLR